MKVVHVFKIINIKAFTLVELLVVLGLFSSVATLSLGALFNAQAINGRLQETQSILDNINLSSQTIIRDIRFGSHFNCAAELPYTLLEVPMIRKDCAFDTSGGGVLIFRSADASDDRDRVAYYIRKGILYKEEYPFGGASSTLQMTADDVVINDLTFYVSGAYTSDGSNDYLGQSDLRQPLVTILISGNTKPRNAVVSPTSFSLQTSVSSRDLDNR